MSQLIQNTINLDTLIEKANALPKANENVETCTINNVGDASNSNYKSLDFIATRYIDGIIEHGKYQINVGESLTNVVKNTLAQTIRSGGDSLENFNILYHDYTLYCGVVLGDIATYNYICYLRNTLISLSNHSTKKVQDITYDDKLLVWDFDNGCYTSAKPLWIKRTETATYYYRCTFENGIVLNLVGSDGNCHRVFSVEDGRFEYANNCVGKKVYTEQGITTLLSCERVEDIVEYYNIITDYHMNLFADGVLTSCRMNNIYPIKDMKFIKGDRERVMYENFLGVHEKWYYGLRLYEQPISVDDIIKYVDNLEKRKK